MYSYDKFATCIDLNRSLLERNGVKPPIYYKRDLLSKIFGICREPTYEIANSSKTVADLWWKLYGTIEKLSDANKAFLMKSWLALFDCIVEEQEILNQIEKIREQQSEEYKKGLAKGYKYQFLDPFVVLIREYEKKGYKEIWVGNFVKKGGEI